VPIIPALRHHSALHCGRFYQHRPKNLNITVNIRTP
jgi:hypothetical protein